MASKSLPQIFDFWATNASLSLTNSTTPISTFTTSYCFTAQAAGATSTWLATHTINKTCTGSRTTWTLASIPPGFTTTIITGVASALTVTCPVNSAAVASTWDITSPAATETLTTITTRPISTDEVWWAGPLLTASPAAPTAKAAMYVTAGAVTVWGSMALLSGVITFAVGWLLWEM